MSDTPKVDALWAKHHEDWFFAPEEIWALARELERGTLPEDGGITQALVQMARDNALEEAARMCESFNADNFKGAWDERDWTDMAAAAIRALLSQPQGDSE